MNPNATPKARLYTVRFRVSPNPRHPIVEVHDVRATSHQMAIERARELLNGSQCIAVEAVKQ